MSSECLALEFPVTAWRGKLADCTNITMYTHMNLHLCSPIPCCKPDRRWTLHWIPIQNVVIPINSSLLCFIPGMRPHPSILVQSHPPPRRCNRSSSPIWCGRDRRWTLNTYMMMWMSECRLKLHYNGLSNSTSRPMSYYYYSNPFRQSVLLWIRIRTNPKSKPAAYPRTRWCLQISLRRDFTLWLSYANRQIAIQSISISFPN